MPLTLRSGMAFTHQRAHACWGQYSGHEHSQKHDRRCGSVGHFRKLYLRVCEMRKFVRKLPLIEIAFQRAARGFRRQCLLSVRCRKLARDPAFIGAIPLRAASPRPHQFLPPAHQRIPAVSRPIALLEDKPRPGPTVRLRDGNNLVVNWRSADPVVSQPDDPCPRTA